MKPSQYTHACIYMMKSQKRIITQSFPVVWDAKAMVALQAKGDLEICDKHAHVLISCLCYLLNQHMKEHQTFGKLPCLL